MQTSLTRSWQISQAQNSRDFKDFTQTPQVSAKTSKMLKALCLSAFVACVAQAQNLDAEIERLEKQKKILELKRQNNQLQKELDRTGTRSNPQNSAPNNYPNNYQNTQGNYQGNYPNNYPKSKQNYPKGNQPQYYGPPAQNQQQNKARYYYEEEEDDEEVIYTSKKDTQFYIRLEGGAYAGGWLRVAPLAGLELGVKFNDNGRLFLGSSYAWGKGNQFIVDGYVGVGWIPRFFDSPVRFVLDSYIGGSYGEWNYENREYNFEKSKKASMDATLASRKPTVISIYDITTGRSTGAGFLAGLRTGLAFDIGRHTWLEFGAKLDATVGSLYNLVGVAYGSFSVLF